MSNLYSYIDENAGPRSTTGVVKPIASNVVKPSNLVTSNAAGVGRRPTGRVALGDISNRAPQPVDPSNLKKKVSS